MLVQVLPPSSERHILGARMYLFLFGTGGIPSREGTFPQPPARTTKAPLCVRPAPKIMWLVPGALGAGTLKNSHVLPLSLLIQHSGLPPHKP